MKNTFLLLFTLISVSIYAQYTYEPINCDNIPLEDGFDIHYLDGTAKLGEVKEEIIAVRLPTKSNDVLDFNEKAPHNLNVDCKPFLKGMKVTKVSFVDFNAAGNAFEKIGINKRDFSAEGGQKVCLKLKGTPDKTGKIPLEFKIKAYVSKLGIPSPVNPICTVSGSHILVQ